MSLRSPKGRSNLIRQETASAAVPPRSDTQVAERFLAVARLEITGRRFRFDLRFKEKTAASHRALGFCQLRNIHRFDAYPRCA